MLLKGLNTYRQEDKFLINIDKENEIKNDLKNFFFLDKNSLDGSGYYNFSVYFDTPNYKFYREKKEGLRDRIKLRLRCHLKNLNEKPSFWFLEIKSRFAGTSQKKRFKVNSHDANEILNGNYTFIKNDKLSKSIFYLLCAKYLLRPSVTVFYYREAFLSNIFPTTRITFDKKICSSQNFFPIEYFINKNYIIKQKEVLIEVKYHKFLPELIRKIFIRNNLYKITFSKYAKCLENS